MAGKGVDRERAPHPCLVHMRGEDGVVRRVIDTVGEAEHRRADDQVGIAQVKREQGKGKPAHDKTDQQDEARANPVHQIADRRLRQSGHHRKHGDREAEFDEADAKLLLEERKQHRQHQNIEMADPVRDGDSRQRAQRRVTLSRKIGNSVDHAVRGSFQPAR